MSMSEKDYRRLFRNPYFSAFVSYLGLAIFGVIFPTWWIVVFSIFASFVICDVILNLIIRGDKGWTKIFGENTFACKGHAYIALFIAIIFTSLFSAFLSEQILQYTQSQVAWVWTVLITDLVVVLAVLGDLFWRFY
jgi:predicted neutral ceramidase superfamily lipid hydrolase